MLKRVVILVDDRKRDLPGCALIAHHLETRFQASVEMQPLESWRACLAAFKPHYILFNHLNASHLDHFSRRLAAMGILVGVLPNEGIIYDREMLAFNAGQYHSYGHIDQFFCWNEAHQDALRRHMNLPPENIHVVGIPRFDYYFEPWRRVFQNPENEPGSGPPRLLMCTNFGFAMFKDLPRGQVDKFFLPYQGRLPMYQNYWDLIEANVRSRNRFFDFLNTLVAETEYFLDVKPHPRENRIHYQKWWANLSSADRKRVNLRFTETIFEVLPLCDLEISCERCTTALESWLIGKPTIELVFERHPAFFDADAAECNRLCDTPANLPGLIRHELENPEQKDLADNRRKHLAQWCASPAGDSSLKTARIIAQALARQEPRWRLSPQDWRRAGKLKLKGLLGLAYGSNPWRRLQGLAAGSKQDVVERKSIRSADVMEWKEKLLQVESP